MPGQKRSRESASLLASSSDYHSGNGGIAYSSSSSSSSFSSNASSASAAPELDIFSEALRARQQSLMEGLPQGLWNATQTTGGVAGQLKNAFMPQSAAFAGGLPLNSLPSTQLEQSRSSLSLAPSHDAFSPPLPNNSNAASANDAGASEWRAPVLQWATSSRDRVLSLAQYLLSTTPFIGIFR